MPPLLGRLAGGSVPGPVTIILSTGERMAVVTCAWNIALGGDWLEVMTIDHVVWHVRASAVIAETESS